MELMSRSLTGRPSSTVLLPPWGFTYTSTNLSKVQGLIMKINRSSLVDCLLQPEPQATSWLLLAEPRASP